MSSSTIFSAKISGIKPSSITSAGSGGITETGTNEARKALGITTNIDIDLGFEVSEGGGNITLDFPNYQKKGQQTLNFHINQLLGDDSLMGKEENKQYRRFLYTLKEFLRKEMLDLGVPRFFAKYKNKDLTFSSDSFPEIENIKTEGGISTGIVELMNSYLETDKDIPEEVQAKFSVFDLVKILLDATRKGTGRDTHSGHDGAITAVDGIFKAFLNGGMPVQNYTDKKILNKLGAVIVKLPKISTFSYMKAYNQQIENQDPESKPKTALMDRNSEIVDKIFRALNENNIDEVLKLFAETTQNHIKFMEDARNNPIDPKFTTLIERLKKIGVYVFIGAAGDNITIFFDKEKYDENEVKSQLENILREVFGEQENFERDFKITDLNLANAEPRIEVSVDKTRELREGGETKKPKINRELQYSVA